MKNSYRQFSCIVATTLMIFLSTLPLIAQDPKLEADLKVRVQHYLASYFKLAPQESVVVNELWSVEKPPMWGLAVTRKQGGKTQDDVYMLSKDLKTLSLGRVLDFTRDLDVENLEKINLSDAPSRGPSNAPVTLVQYCDLQCPDCKTMVENLKLVLPSYDQKVRVVFKNYPLVNKHAWAESSALAARCAYLQRPEAFWTFYNYFYSEQDSISSANIREKVSSVAKQSGLDVTKFGTCYDSKATLRSIQEDMYEAAKLGVRGTPTILVNGRFVFNEEMTDKDYRKLIDEALAHPKK